MAQLKEVWQFRYLIASFAIRDYKVRFAQTALGYVWAFVQPLISLSVLYLVFSQVLHISSNDVPYFPFALSGLMFWNYFNSVTTQSASGLIQAQPLIKKIYFPRLSIPFSKGLVGLVEFVVAFILLIAMGFYFHFISLLSILGSTLLLAWATLASQGIGLWISSLSIRYRDLQQLIPFGLQLLFFLTPVAYPVAKLSAIIPTDYQWLMFLNPLMGLVDASRYLWFGIELSPFWWISLVTSLILFLSGLLVFNKTEKKLADLL